MDGRDQNNCHAIGFWISFPIPMTMAPMVTFFITKKVAQLKFFLEEPTNFKTLNHNTHLCRLLTTMNFEVLSMEYGIHNWILFIHGFGVIFNQNCDDETWVC